MKDFPYWRGAIHDAKTPHILKSIGEDLAQFQSQSNLIGGDPKLNKAQLDTLRTQYSERMKKLQGEKL